MYYQSSAAAYCIVFTESKAQQNQAADVELTTIWEKINSVFRKMYPPYSLQ